jgi:hypothetical protein
MKFAGFMSTMVDVELGGFAHIEVVQKKVEAGFSEQSQ